MAAAIQISHSIWVDAPQPGVVLIGCTDNGKSAALVVRPVHPFFYFVLSERISTPKAFATQFMGLLEAELKDRFRSGTPVVEWTLEQRTPADHYRIAPSTVLRVTFSSKAVADAARRLARTPDKWLDPVTAAGVAHTAEADVDPAARYLVETFLNPEAWLTWPAGAGVPLGQRITSCALEKHVKPSVVRQSGSDRAGDAPKKVVAITVRAEGSAVRGVAAISVAIGCADRTVWECAVPAERDILHALDAHLKEADPDVLVTFGARRVDWRLLEAAYARNGMTPFHGWSRLKGVPTQGDPDRADAARVTNQCPGRIEFDVQAWLQRNQVRYHFHITI